MHTAAYTVPALLLLLFAAGTLLALGKVKNGRFGERAAYDAGGRLASIKKKLKNKTHDLGLGKAIRSDAIEREIYEGLSILKNLIFAHHGELNTDYVLSELSESDGVLKETYIKMLSLIRTGREREAANAMSEAAGTETGREYASLLISWEYLKPEQLLKSIESYRSTIREKCVTRQKKRDALISDFIYFPATANVFLIFINFIYISYFMEQREMMQMIF